MKIIKTEGCIAGDLTFDGISEVDLTLEERNRIIDYLFMRYKEEYNQGTVSLIDLISLFQYDDRENDGYRCEQCGDTVTTTTWEI